MTYSTRRTREQWSDWAYQALNDVGPVVQGLVRASLHTIASSGAKPRREVWDAVERARKRGMAVDYRDDSNGVGPGAMCSACGEPVMAWAEVRHFNGRSVVLVCRPCIKAMGEGLDEYSAAMASDEDS